MEIRRRLPGQGHLWRFFASVAVALAWTMASTRAETLTLAQCLHEVAEHNPAIAQQRATVERATATRLTLHARALPVATIGGIAGELVQQNDNLPTVVATANGGRRVLPATVTTDNSLLVLGTGSIYQSLFDAAIPASFRRGTVGILAAEQNFYSVASVQLHAARLLFYQALYQQQEGELLHQIDGTLGEGIKSQSQLVAAGLAGRTSLISAQVQRTNFNPIILSTTGSYRTSLASLLQTMGRELSYQGGDDPLAHLTLSGTLDDAPLRFDPTEAARTALARRPDFRSLRAMVKIAQEDANISRGNYYPLIRLYVAGEYVPGSDVRNRPNAVRSSDQTEVTEVRPGIMGSWVVVDTGGTTGTVRIQESQRDTLAIGLRQLESNLPSEIATVHARFADAAGRIAALAGNVDAAQDTLNIIQGGLAQGINSQTEFLYAQTEFANVRVGLLAAHLEMSLAHAEFDRLTGNYLRYVEEAPASTARHPAKK